MANPYNVAIQLALASNHEKILHGLSSGLLGVIPHIEKLEGRFRSLGAAITGALGIAVGVEMISILKNFTKETAVLSDELTKLQMAGLTGPQRAQAQAEAIRIQKMVPSMTSVDILKIIGQLYEPLGFENSLKIAPSAAKFAAVMRSAGKGGHSDDAVYEAIRAAEMSGHLTDPGTGKPNLEILNKFFDTVARFKTSTHGRVTEKTWLNMMQQGGPALMNMSPEGLGTMGQVAQVMGGFRAGTAMMSLFSQFGGGVMTKKKAEALQAAGLLGPAGDIDQGADWGVSEKGTVRFSDASKKRLGGLIGNDPLDFAKTLKEKLEGHGVTDHGEQIRKLFEMLMRQTSTRFVADMLRNIDQMEQSRQRAMGGLPVEGSLDALDAGSVSFNIEKVEAAWKEFQYALAGPNSENTIKMLHLLADGINYFTEKVRGMDPKTLEDLGKGIVVLSGALIGGGAAALVAAMGPVGWLVGGIVALTGALVAFKKDFENNETLKAIDQWGKKIAQAILGALDSVLGAIRGWFGFGGAAPQGVPGQGPPGNFDSLPPDGSFVPTTPGGTPGYVPGVPGSPGFLPPGNSLVPNRFGFVPDAGGPGPRTQGGSGSPPFVPKRMNYTPADQYGGYQNAIHTSGRGGGGANQPIIVSLNIDGRKISEALSATLAELMEFPNQAPYHDTYGGYTSNDSQFADT